MNNLSVRRRMQSKLGSETQGYQILAVRRPRKVVPPWVDDDKKIQEFLLRSFPLLKKNAKQRKQAARWVRIIHLYYRRHWSCRLIAEELGMSFEAIHYLLYSIRRAAEGLRTDGRKRTTKPNPVGDTK